MRSRTTLYALLFAIGLFALPYAAHAANAIPFFGPIVPDETARCAAGWGAVIQVINNIIRFLITLIVVFIAPLMLAYAGFMYVVNPVNPSNIQKAKDMMLNTIYGLIVALIGWMVVDAVMVVLYNPDINHGKAWSDLITSGGANFCLIEESALKTLNQADLNARISGGGMAVSGGGTTGALCSNANPACSPTALQNAGFSAPQSRIMSCIAVTESSGNPGTPPYNTTHPSSNSTACGTFQITKTTWSTYASGACSDFSNCTNADCNMQVAKTLVSNNGYKDWTCANCNSKASSCIQQYGG